MTYAKFLNKKTHLAGKFGFKPISMPDCLFDFQSYLVDWSIRKGRAAIFADCGMGKTPMQLVWADNVVRKSNRPVLLLTPLAVSSQTVQEAEKFGIDAVRSGNGEFEGKRIIVTNYERLHKFNPSDFSGMVCDESSILKNFDGMTKAAITDFMRKLKYRLLCTATAAPNDYIELGTSSEALGDLGYMDMLGQFFNTSDKSLHPHSRAYTSHKIMGGKFRFKSHAEGDFWRWLCSWARACRKPSDLGFDDGRFILPPLEIKEHRVASSRPMSDRLFTVPAKGLKEQRRERRHTIKERCEKAAGLACSHDGPVVIWCHLNDEGNLLEKLIPGCIQIAGKDSDAKKEEKLIAFSTGQVRALITKPVIGAWGLNWQHCNRMVMFPSHSFEQYYQSIRRSWRFGQKRTVHVDLVSTEGEADVMANLNRKAEAADKMFSMIVQEMNNELRIKNQIKFSSKVESPSWLKS